MLRVILIALVFAAPAVVAGGHTAANEQRTAAAHAGDKPVATPAATLAPAQPVNSRAAIYTTVDGQEVTGWLAWPAGQSTADLPGLIVIHEWWGLNDNIRQAAERLAGEGYVALAVDLYRGESGANPKDAMRLMQSLNKAESQGRDNLAAAYDYLTTVSGTGKVGVIGWCLGGRWSLQAALRLPAQLDAAVIYYGNVIADKAQLETLQMPILGLFAGVDPVVPRDSVLAFEQALRELGKQVDIHIYPDAQHAFSNPSGMAYDPVAAADAWGKTTAFLAAHLK
jgi:carboxymethylenebutenolidase